MRLRRSPQIDDRPPLEPTEILPPLPEPPDYLPAPRPERFLQPMETGWGSGGWKALVLLIAYFIAMAYGPLFLRWLFKAV